MEEVLGVRSVAARVVAHICIVVMSEGLKNDAVTEVRDDLKVGSVVLWVQKILGFLVVRGTAVDVGRKDEIS